MIEVTALRKVYRGKEDVVAVDEVSFRAERGEIFGLLGPNGAGKTTTLRMIATMLRPTSGTVKVDGVDAVADPPEVRGRIGFLSSNTGLYERHSPRELLETFGALHGLRGQALKRRIDELIQTFHMESFADRYCGLLSTGQRQKASIARALVHDPPVLVFDEPTSGLDVLVAHTLVEQIAALRADSRTIVLSSHIMPEVERLCDRVAVIHQGKIRASGSQAELLTQTGAESLEQAFFALVQPKSEEAA